MLIIGFLLGWALCGALFITVRILDERKQQAGSREKAERKRG